MGRPWLCELGRTVAVADCGLPPVDGARWGLSEGVLWLGCLREGVRTTAGEAVDAADIVAPGWSWEAWGMIVLQLLFSQKKYRWQCAPIRESVQGNRTCLLLLKCCQGRTACDVDKDLLLRAKLVKALLRHRAGVVPRGIARLSKLRLEVFTWKTKAASKSLVKHRQ